MSACTARGLAPHFTKRFTVSPDSASTSAHAWYDPSADEEGRDPPHEKGAYKLPHHEIVDGRLRVVWNGVRSAMGVLQGARGGVDIP